MLKRIPATLLAFSLPLAARAGEVPDFSLKKLDGSVFQLRSARGKQVIVIDFWATWCGPCVKELKRLQELKNRHPEVLVLAISVDDAATLDKVAPFIRSKGYDFTVLLDPDTNVSRMFNPSKVMPYTMVVDRQGRAAYIHTGYVDGDEVELGRQVEALLK